MGVWNGNLRNSPFDIAIDLRVLISSRSEHWNNEHRLVIIALALANLPQIIRLNTGSSTKGLSPYFLLFNAIYSNLQLAHALLLAGYGYPTTETPVLALIGSGAVTGMKALGGILGLLQVTCQWICSMMLYVFAPVLLFQSTIRCLFASVSYSTLTTRVVEQPLQTAAERSLSQSLPTPRSFWSQPY